MHRIQNVEGEAILHHVAVLEPENQAGGITAVHVSNISDATEKAGL